MSKRFRSKSLVVTILVVIIFGLGVSGALSIEPPGTYKYTGKGITAVLTLTIVPLGNTEVVVEVLVTGCSDQPLVFGPLVNTTVPNPAALVNLTPDLLLDQLVGYAPPGCFSTSGGEELRISKVYEFYNAASYQTDCSTGLTVPRGAVGAYLELNKP